ncbi:hypothetical protein J6590_077871, partial [Homalodisca vitripennis]
VSLRPLMDHKRVKSRLVEQIRALSTDVMSNEDDSNQTISGVTLGSSDNRILGILSASWWPSQLHTSLVCLMEHRCQVAHITIYVHHMVEKINHFS